MARYYLKFNSHKSQDYWQDLVAAINNLNKVDGYGSYYSNCMWLDINSKRATYHKIKFPTPTVKCMVIRGVFEYTVAFIESLTLSQYSYYERDVTLTVDNQTITVKDSQIQLVDSSTPTQLCKLSKEEKAEMKKSMAPKELTNKFGQTFSVGSLIVVFSSSLGEMVYGKVDELFHGGKFSYITTDGTKRRCSKADMIYVPTNQDEFEGDFALEVLKEI